VKCVLALSLLVIAEAIIIDAIMSWLIPWLIYLHWFE
jgi:hypothetical protein